MAGAKRKISSPESPKTQSRRKKGKQVARPENEILVLSSDKEECGDPTYPTPDQTTILGEDSDDDPGTVSTVKTRSKHTNDTSATAGSSKAKTSSTTAPKPRGRPRKKRAGSFIVDDEEEVQPTKPKRQAKRKRANVVESDEEDEPADGDAGANPMEGFGQKKHTLEWLHMTFRSASFEKAQVNITETLKNESERALVNAQRKLEHDKTAVLNQQIRLAELENERKALMTPNEREVYAQVECEQLRKEVEQLKIRCVTKGGEYSKLKMELVDAQTNLEKEKGNRMAMEARLIRAGLNRDEEAYVTGS